ncbi:hypothetical protein B0T21DRAFT_346365 [Apiosordaria backusii]|uniref:Uncharacterized protein n=1 Tax=Apiosordaria backusii TaxID=314023 RepID=A0AA40EIN0_9PEZI|nr:hypothetical protein B0T21DRAFT_346365 [Apiosordaria backusii]
MRFFKLLLAMAAMAYAIPGPSELIQADEEALANRSPEGDFEPHPGDELQVKEGYSLKDFVPIKRSPDASPAPLPDPERMPVLDDLIDAHEREKRTANLSPVNNPTKGLLPRACRNDSTCPCARGAQTGLWCGYCVRPVDAIYRCRYGACLNWVYQCGPGNDCCTFGYRRSCAQRNGPCGP